MSAAGFSKRARGGVDGVEVAVVEEVGSVAFGSWWCFWLVVLPFVGAFLAATLRSLFWNFSRALRPCGKRRELDKRMRDGILALLLGGGGRGSTDPPRKFEPE